MDRVDGLTFLREPRGGPIYNKNRAVGTVRRAVSQTDSCQGSVLREEVAAEGNSPGGVRRRVGGRSGGGAGAGAGTGTGGDRGKGKGTNEHGGLEGPFPGQDLPFELEGSHEFDHICANRKVRNITERN